MPFNRTHFWQIVLFVATLITTTLSGAEWMFGRPFILVEERLGWEHFVQGFQFSIPFLLILTVHEFGHYFAAKYHQVKVTLPYYIPLWIGFGESIGTLGAFIKIQEIIKSRKKYFDIGIAGPLAGFFVAVGVLWYGFANLPTLDYIFKIHPDYQKYGLGFARVVYANKSLGGSIMLGDNLLFNFFKTYVADPERLPPPQEMMHYPLILAGYLALFFTSLNLIPIGQLDGGHILYGLIGNRASRIVSPVLFWIFAAYAGLGFFKHTDFTTINDEGFYEQLGYLALYAVFLQLCFSSVSENVLNTWILALSVILFQFAFSYFWPIVEGYTNFLPFVFLLGRFLGVYHPPTEDTAPLNWQRQALGWFALLVFVLCFSPKPFIIL
jgi:membrane-associated protease RseP (regulator of RpoE activity)